MDRIWVDGRFAEVCARMGLGSVEAFSRFFGMSGVGGKKSVELREGKIGEVGVFYKQYDHGREWRYALRWSKARREFESYAAMERLGVRCAVRVACGEQRDGMGRLRRAFILTVAIAEAKPLGEFVGENCGIGMGARGVRASIVEQLAGMTRRAHGGGFVHSDLWVRNVLVNWEVEGRPGVWWIDSPRGRVWKFFSGMGAVRDLASLDKGGAFLFTRGERMRFICRYLGKREVDGEVRRLVEKVLGCKEREGRRGKKGRREMEVAGMDEH